MGYLLNLPDKKSAGPWRVLYHPMLVVSLVLHGAILVLPMPSQPEAPPEVEEPEEAVDIIQLSALTVRPQATPQPTPQVALQQAAQPRPAALQPVPQPRPEAPPPVPQPNLSPSPAPPATQPTDTAPPADNAVPPADLAPPPFDPSPGRQGFLANLPQDGDLGNLTPEPSFFAHPDAYFVSPRDRTSATLAGINAMQWYNQPREDTYSILEQSYEPQGLTFVAVPGGYGGDDLYELQDPDGNTLFFLSLASGKGGASTILVTWEFNPNQPPN